MTGENPTVRRLRSLLGREQPITADAFDQCLQRLRYAAARLGQRTTAYARAMQDEDNPEVPEALTRTVRAKHTTPKPVWGNDSQEPAAKNTSVRNVALQHYTCVIRVLCGPAEWTAPLESPAVPPIKLPLMGGHPCVFFCRQKE